MICHACQAQVPEHAKFCIACGSKLALFCPGCNSEVNEDQRFCANCGDRLPEPAEGTSTLEPKAKVSHTTSLKPSLNQGDEGDRRVVTVLFTDVSGFTSMSEKMDPEEVTEIVNQFFSVLTQPIYKYGGVVDKYIGDAIMALFGAPVAHEDDPFRAISAAWEMQRTAKEFAAKLLARTGIQLRIRVGLNTGLVVAGAVGGAQKQDYTVMGDTVNLAQRMEANASLGGVLVTQETYKLTKDFFDYQEREPVKVKGKEEPVKVYDLIGPNRLKPSGKVSSNRFVGRAADLNRLSLCLQTASEGHPQLVNVSGEAGIGKSRLSEEFANRLDGRWGLMKGRCPSWAQETSYALISNLLRQWLDIPSELPHENIVRRLQESCALYCPEDQDRSVSLLAYLLSIDLPHKETSGLSPQQKRSSAYLVLNDLFIAVVRKNPLVITLSDLHWIDEASLEWLHTFVERIAEGELPLVLILKHRPTVDRNLSDWGDRIDLSRVRLRPFGAEESAALVGNLIDCEPRAWPPPLKQLIQQVSARAEGNPLYLTELIHSLIEAHVLVPDPSNPKVLPMRAGQTLPSTINGVVASRLDMLKPNLRSLLQVASVVGRSFHPQLLAKVYPISNLTQVLAELVKFEFIQPRNGGEYTFNQGIIQEVAYQSLLLSSRRKLHHLLATSLEEMLGERSEEQSKLLAHHWSRAEEPYKSCRYLFLAGERAKGNFSNLEAISCYKQSLDWLNKCGEGEAAKKLPSRFDIFVSLAEIETTMGTYAQAQSHLEEALGLSEDPTVKAKVHFLLSQTFERRGDFEAALAQCEAGIPLLAGKGGLELARLLNEKGWLKYREGDYQGCIQLNQQALSQLVKTDGNREMARAYSDIGACLYRLNHWNQSLESHRTALRFREEAEDVPGMAISFQNLGMVHYELGEWDQAAENYQKGLAIHQKVGDVGNISGLQINLGDLLGNQGKIKEAEHYLRQTLELNRRIGDNYMIGLALCGIGNVISLDGQKEKCEEAIALLKEGLAMLETIGAVDLFSEVNQILGRVHLDCGKSLDGCRYLAKGMELSRSTKNLLQVGVISRLHATHSLAQGMREAAALEIKEALKILENIGSKLELARAQWVASEIMEEEEAKGLRQAAIAVFKQLNARLDLEKAEASGLHQHA